MNESAARTFRNLRREALFVVGIWFLALLWTVGYSATYAYDAKPSITFGMPSWVCWGIVAPAIICSIITLLFGLFGMKDDPLESP